MQVYTTSNNTRWWLQLSMASMCAVACFLSNKNHKVSAYSFVPQRQQQHTSVGNMQAQQRLIFTRTTNPHVGSGGGGMTMKKRPLSTRPVPSSTDGEIPQNLKRKVVAKRQLRGDIVPKGKRKGGTSQPTLRPQGKTRLGANNNPSNLKILGGTARGRHLSSPDVYLRPMMGKVREAVYSTFTSFGLYDEGVRTKHLDIFSGSGSVGLESLSRGAVHCTFVDLSRDCCDTIERNVVKCDFGEEEGGGGRNGVVTRVVCDDALRVLRDPVGVGIPDVTTYNIITLCPPYEEITYADLLDAAVNSPLLTEDTIILVEYPTELGCLPHVLNQENGGKLIGIRNRRYGRTVIAMYIANPTGRLEKAESRPEEFITV